MTARKKETVKVADKRLQNYELVYIVSPELADEALESTVSGISQFITNKEGVISNVDRWGKRKLAYPVGRFLEGNYVLTKFSMNSAHCRDFEVSLKISEKILRHLLVKLDN